MSNQSPTFQELIDRIREEVLMETSTARWTDAELLAMVIDACVPIIAKYKLGGRRSNNRAVTSAAAQTGRLNIQAVVGNNSEILRDSVLWVPQGVTSGGHRLKWRPREEVEAKRLRLPIPTTQVPEIYWTNERMQSASGVTSIHFAPAVRNSATIDFTWILDPRDQVGTVTVGSALNASHNDMDKGGMVEVLMYRVAAKIYHAGGETARMNEAMQLAQFYEREWAMTFGHTGLESDMFTSLVQGGGQQ